MMISGGRRPPNGQAPPWGSLGELAAKQTEGGGKGAGNWKLQWKTDRNDRFFESILPSHRFAVFPRESTCLPIETILPCAFR